MKILEFASKSNVSVRTLRYYVQENLLFPGKKDGQLDFDECCAKDLSEIQALKDAGFYLKEIQQWMDARKNSHEGDAIRNRKKLELLQLAKKRLELEEEEIDGMLLALREEISRVQRLQTHHVSGIHTDFLPYLCCPDCGNPLNYEHVHIVGQELLEGKAYCTCGYHGTIQNGIFHAQGQSDETMIVPIDTNRETYGRLKPAGINILQKDFHWILKKLQSQTLSGKIVFENFINTICFLSTGLQFLDPEAYYIIADSDYLVVADVKARIEALDLPLKVLFLVNDTLNYPIKKHCVDIVLDYFHSEIIQGYQIPSLEEGMLRFVHPGSQVVGIYTYIRKGTKTLENNRRMFPDSYPGRFQLKALKDNFHKCGLRILDQQDEHVLTYSVIASYGEGDTLGEYCFWAEYLQQLSEASQL